MGISTIIPNFLYLGAARDTKNVNEMKQFKISHVISCAGKLHGESDYKVLKGHLEDEEDQPIIPFIEEQAYHFIEEARLEKGRVFVHCLAGRSRSASVILGYLLMSKRLPLSQLYYTVLDRRSIILPNNGFMHQLMDFEFRLLANRSMKSGEWTTAMLNRVKPDARSMGQANIQLQTSDTCGHVYLRKESQVSEQTKAYIDKIVTAEEVVNSFGGDDDYIRLRALIESRRDCSQAITKLRKRLCIRLQESTDSGLELRQLEPLITWDDIKSLICMKTIQVLEQDLFNMSIP
ncbi:hypothetical protein DFA_01482 [Cavenderia fasciculata]|uniref:protein-tyrosine-phosphatase n=1 Tax=Cavenderia fasciculata TaxID=261658 RepID=F4PT20_CACFS|nr:uncharacterized protein DFA_01482 [Cavenderia fasciculata]EGG21596.1 hypothetical protein DFA_01482 [Cavenderia fasciculata]|eukprot:XP_004359446.1 hypothetical protein DFA_01482 [Cavenderia fasciculata]